MKTLKTGQEIFFFALFLFLSYQPRNAFSAAWTQAQGETQLILNLSAYSSENYFDGNSNKNSSEVKFNKFEINPFIEYGLTDTITIGSNVSTQLWRFDKKGSNSAIFDFRQCGLFSNTPGDIINTSIIESEFFFRKRLYKKNNLVFSVQPLVKAPCISVQNGSFEFIDKTTDIEMRFLAGYGFEWNPDIQIANIKRPFAGQYHFLNLEAAYRKRSSLFSDQIKFDGTAGFRLKNNLLLMGQMFTAISTGDESVRAVISNNQLFTEEDNYYTVKAQISAIHQLTKSKSLQIGISKEIAGKNSGDGIGATLSLWYGF